MSTDTTNNKVIIPLDASSLTHSYCIRHWFLDAVAGYKQKGLEDISMHFGSSLHKFAEHFYLSDMAGLTEDAQVMAIVKAKKYFQSKECYTSKDKEHLDVMFLLRVCNMLADYIRQDKFKIVVDSNNMPLVEWKFAIPIAEYEDAIVMLYGTLDKVQQLNTTGLTLIGDWKSSRHWNTEDYFNSYKLNIQLPIYTYAIWWFALHKPDSIFGSMWQRGIRSYIDLISIPKSKDPSIIRSNLFEFKEDDIDTLDHILRVKAETLYKQYKKEALPFKEGQFNGTCRTMYGNCKYAVACSMSNDSDTVDILNSKFKQEKYDPLSFR